MWTINSNDVQQAKDRIERRRAEIETRYAEDKRALDAESAVIETLDRVAAEFAVRNSREDPGVAATPPVTVDAPDTVDLPGAGSPLDIREDVGTAPTSPPELEPSAGEEMGGGFDILKPGSRWRLNRANRLSNPEGTPTGTTPTTW